VLWSGLTLILTLTLIITLILDPLIAQRYQRSLRDRVYTADRVTCYNSVIRSVIDCACREQLIKHFLNSSHIPIVALHI